MCVVWGFCIAGSNVACKRGEQIDYLDYVYMEVIKKINENTYLVKQFTYRLTAFQGDDHVDYYYFRIVDNEIFTKYAGRNSISHQNTTSGFSRDLWRKKIR